MFQFVIGNLYGSGLASVMTVKRYDTPISNVPMLVKSGMIWGGPSPDFYFAILNTENSDLRKFIDEYQIYTIEKCEALGKQLKMSLVAEQMQYGMCLAKVNNCLILNTKKHV